MSRTSNPLPADRQLEMSYSGARKLKGFIFAIGAERPAKARTHGQEACVGGPGAGRGHGGGPQQHTSKETQDRVGRARTKN